MSINYRDQILEKIKKAGKEPLPYKRLLRSCKVPDKEFKSFTSTLEGLKKKGEIFEQRDGFLMPKFCGLVKGRVVKLSKTFAFVANVETNEEIFVPGKFLKGAMPEDIVLLKTYEGRGESLEGEVFSIVKEGFSKFTGVIKEEFGTLTIIPDNLSKYALQIENLSDFDLKPGDKVIGTIAHRGQRHSEHTAKILMNFGSSEKACVCAESIVKLNGISLEFPDNVIENAKEVSDFSAIQKEAPNRLDLRDLPIFTIDGADTKDIDDAISLSETDNGYKLGVHIADVSFYVKAKSPLDTEALERGTSVYYANKVVPMLPKELSNGICSLNPQEDRLAFSALMEIDSEGKLVDYKFAKTIIRSRVKGVYSEINSIIAQNQTDEINEKYKEVIPEISTMVKLSNILKENKIKRGTPQLETSESKLVIDENEVCVDVIPRSRGISEEMIEDFMLMANEAAAKLGNDNLLPFVYRIHEDPSPEKIATLEATLRVLGIEIPPHTNIKPAHLAAVIDKTKGTDLELIVNNLVLRSMAKAKYSTDPIGHFGLVLKDYAHFTSPIRRYPDLSIHRIMSDFLSGTKQPELMKRFQKFVFQSAQASSDAELKSMTVERDCEDCYKAEYLKSHLGEEFEGRIISVMNFGFFVELSNTCEGLVAIEALPDGEYTFDGAIKLTNNSSGFSYRVGDKVKIIVAKSEVSSGRVDFSLA